MGFVDSIGGSFSMDSGILFPFDPFTRGFSVGRFSDGFSSCRVTGVVTTVSFRGLSSVSDFSSSLFVEEESEQPEYSYSPVYTPQVDLSPLFSLIMSNLFSPRNSVFTSLLEMPRFDFAERDDEQMDYNPRAFVDVVTPARAEQLEKDQDKVRPLIEEAVADAKNENILSDDDITSMDPSVYTKVPFLTVLKGLLENSIDSLCALFDLSNSAKYTEEERQELKKKLEQLQLDIKTYLGPTRGAEYNRRLKVLKSSLQDDGQHNAFTKRIAEAAAPLMRADAKAFQTELNDVLTGKK